MANKKNVDPRQRELQELIELKKMQQAAAENKDSPAQSSLTQKEEEIKPKTFREKWSNYWYHYKFHTWATVFIVVVAVWMIKDLFFGPKYDITITTACKYYFSALNEDVEKELTQYASDYNGDGKTNILFDEMTIVYGDAAMDGDYQSNYASMQKLMAVCSAGEDLLFILDQDVYDVLLDEDGNSMFVDLSELYPDCPEIVKGDKLVLNSTKLGRRLGISKAKEDIFICVRALGGSADGSKAKIVDIYNNCLSYVQSIMETEYPELKK